jgi:hypothetical protein
VIIGIYKSVTDEDIDLNSGCIAVVEVESLGAENAVVRRTKQCFRCRCTQDDDMRFPGGFDCSVRIGIDATVRPCELFPRACCSQVVPPPDGSSTVPAQRSHPCQDEARGFQGTVQTPSVVLVSI